jgi:bacterioferritin (cytochrome b1)
MRVFTKSVKALNSLLVDKLDEINQHMSHSEICEKMGYNKLYLAITEQVMDEMFNIEWLIEQIKLLKNEPTTSQFDNCKTVSATSNNINNSELENVHKYIDEIKFARKTGDKVMENHFIKLIKLEDNHFDLLKKQYKIINKVNMKNFQLNQTESYIS